MSEEVTVLRGEDIQNYTVFGKVSDFTMLKPWFKSDEHDKLLESLFFLLFDPNKSMTNPMMGMGLGTPVFPWKEHVRLFVGLSIMNKVKLVVADGYHEDIFTKLIDLFIENADGLKKGTKIQYEPYERIKTPEQLEIARVNALGIAITEDRVFIDLTDENWVDKYMPSINVVKERVIKEQQKIMDAKQLAGWDPRMGPPPLETIDAEVVDEDPTPTLTEADIDKMAEEAAIKIVKELGTAIETDKKKEDGNGGTNDTGAPVQ